MPPKVLETQKKLDDALKNLPQNDKTEAQRAVEALNKLNEAIRPFFVEREDGMPVVFTEANRKELMDAYADAYSGVVKAKVTAAATPEEARLWQNIEDFLAADFTSLDELEPDGFATLPEMMRAARSTMLDKGNEKLENAGANSSSRYAFSYEENGKVVEGFFTPQRLYTGYDTDTMLKYADKLLPDLKYQLKQADKKKQRLDESSMDDDDEDIVDIYEDEAKDALECLKHGLTELGKPENAYNRRCMDVIEKDAWNHALAKFALTPNGRETAKRIYNCIHKALFRKDKDGNMMERSKQSELYRYLSETSGRTLFQYGDVMHAEKGSDISGRNVAMSRVSELLGIPHIISKSSFMTVRDAFGHQTQGVFMQKADGIDIKYVLPDDISNWKNKNASRPIAASLLKSVAELQILDYLCQNADRHEGNMLYQFNKDCTKLVGVVGIDNDESFGTKKPGKNEHINIYQEGKSSYDTPLANLKVIPQKLSDTVKELTPEALKYALQDTGLKEKEIQAAVDRLNALKQAIASKEIEAVEDGKWNQLNMDKLVGENVPQGDYYNTFRMVNKMCFNVDRYAQRNAVAMMNGSKPLHVQYSHATVVFSMKDKKTMQVRREKADQLVQNLAKAQRDIITSGSQKFRNLETTVQGYQKYLSMLMEKPDREKADEIQQKLRQMMNQMKEDAFAYLRYKKVLGNDGNLKKRKFNSYHDNTKARIKLAQDIAIYCDKAMLGLKQQDKPVVDKFVKQARLEKAAQKMVNVLKEDVSAQPIVEKIGEVKLVQILSGTQEAKEVLANPGMNMMLIWQKANNAVQRYNKQAEAEKQKALQAGMERGNQPAADKQVPGLQ